MDYPKDLQQQRGFCKVVERWGDGVVESCSELRRVKRIDWEGVRVRKEERLGWMPREQVVKVWARNEWQSSIIINHSNCAWTWHSQSSLTIFLRCRKRPNIWL